jgi:hypothetical protein
MRAAFIAAGLSALLFGCDGDDLDAAPAAPPSAQPDVVPAVPIVPLDTRAPTGPEVQAALLTRAYPIDRGFDFQAFADSVRVASDEARHQGSKACAEAAADVRTASAGEARSQLHLLVAKHLGDRELAPGREVPCGKPRGATCANLFEFFVTAFDGIMARALRPTAAMLADAAHGNAVLTIWNRESNPHPAITLHAIVEGRLAALIFLQDTQACAVP